MTFVSIAVSSHNPQPTNMECNAKNNQVTSTLINNKLLRVLISLIELKHNNCRRNLLNSLGASTVDCLSLDRTVATSRNLLGMI